MFKKVLVINPSAEMTKGYTEKLLKLPDIFYFQGQVFIFRSFLRRSFGKVMGQRNCYIYYKCCFILSTDQHYNRTVET